MTSKAPHKAEKRKREKFKAAHPEGRKAFAKAKREARLKVDHLK